MPLVGASGRLDVLVFGRNGFNNLSNACLTAGVGPEPGPPADPGLNGLNA